METIRFIIYHLGVAMLSCLVSITLIYAGIRSKKIIVKQILFNVSALFIALFVFEIISVCTGNEDSKVVFSGSFFDNPSVSGKKEFVGYGPRIDTSMEVSAMRKNGNTLIYSVHYTLNYGNRIVLQNNDSSNRYIFFIGCSHVFGDGLEDNQTLPYYFSEQTRHKYNVVNYAFSGFGTHQALQIVENKILPSDILFDSAVVIYYFNSSHFMRAAGYSPWDLYGPEYEVENNQLIYKGSFNKKAPSEQNFVVKRINIIWENSSLYKSFFQPEVNRNDEQLVSKIVTKMNHLLKERKVRFIVLMGPTSHETEYEDEFYRKVREQNIEHYFVDSLIDDLSVNRSLYFIPGDGHPDDVYNKKLAGALSGIINRTTVVE